MDACHSTSRPQFEQLQPRTDYPTKTLGHNGPYFGTVDPIEQDCRRMPEHSELFRDPQRYEADLKTAARIIGRAADSMATSGSRPRDLVPLALETLAKAGQYLKDALLIAEVLGEREDSRLRMIGQGSIHDIVLCSMPDGELSQHLARLQHRAANTRRMITTIETERARRRGRR